MFLSNVDEPSKGAHSSHWQDEIMFTGALVIGANDYGSYDIFMTRNEVCQSVWHAIA